MAIGFSLTIMAFQLELWVLNWNYGLLLAIMGLTLFLCIHVHLTHFFTIDPLGSTLTCYLFFFDMMMEFEKMLPLSINMIPYSSNSDAKTKCNIGRTICVTCTFHLRWAS